MGHMQSVTHSLFSTDTIPQVRQYQPCVPHCGGQVAPEDLVASRGLVVVTVSSRLNAFGFLSLENAVLPGNLGLVRHQSSD